MEKLYFWKCNLKNSMCKCELQKLIAYRDSTKSCEKIKYLRVCGGRPSSVQDDMKDSCCFVGNSVMMSRFNTNKGKGPVITICDLKSPASCGEMIMVHMCKTTEPTAFVKDWLRVGVCKCAWDKSFCHHFGLYGLIKE